MIDKEYPIITECPHYMNKIELYKNRDDTYQFLGLSMGGKITLIKNEENRAIFKVGGGSTWSSRGKTTYYPPELIIGCLNDNIFTGKYIIEYDKQTRKQAIELSETYFNKL